MTISRAFLAPALVRAAVEGRLPRGIGVERLRDAALETTRFWPPRPPKFPAADRHWPSKPCRGERNFWMQRREAKNRPERPQGSPETERVERYRAKIPTETAYLEAAL